ncbi:DUF4148 domain-containing protein [Paucibacter sp. M5-1]|uniref:DUF4148 domain-containing protein n=1 Tax=Paucibacter sp. M5-1 TaxID=3015998 RepID=UPI0022B8C844|nr:DUF4148 domain-containing protein [Paucibacter sp. M5-1]MCZ7882387.1 DUF4148 domain-containing protein [Paucibacter sp. M5-1]
MNKLTLISLCSATLLLAGPALAARDAGEKSREQIKAELAEARLNGTLPVGEDGLTPRQRHPQLYPAKTTLAAKQDANSAAR